MNNLYWILIIILNFEKHCKKIDTEKRSFVNIFGWVTRALDPYLNFCVCEKFKSKKKRAKKSTLGDKEYDLCNLTPSCF
jgi:hypothetical protein